MTCEHLIALERDLQASGVAETYRGQAWSDNCREWVYFEVVLDVVALRDRYALPSIVELHENTDPRSGLERGFVCTKCHDAIMGVLDGAPAFR